LLDAWLPVGKYQVELELVSNLAEAVWVFE
jgi:hypothetical protein